MADIAVTVPKALWWGWLAEGDLVGDPPTERLYDFTVGTRPNIQPGERVYVVAHGRLRGYAPLVAIKLADGKWARWLLVRGGGAVAVTIPQGIRGFRGWRYRWWDRSLEVPFPGWRTP